MGSALNEITPQTSSSMATTTIRKRLLSAKSTRPRIMGGSLFHCALQDEGVLDYPLARLEARANLLHLAGQHLTADHFQTMELTGVDRRVHPVAIVKVQDGGS